MIMGVGDNWEASAGVAEGTFSAGENDMYASGGGDVRQSVNDRAPKRTRLVVRRIYKVFLSLKSLAG